mgnify:CR=1 FL=1
MSFQNLIGANQINYNVQEWLFEEVMNMQKMILKKRKLWYIDKYSWFKREECNITDMRN